MKRLITIAIVIIICFILQSTVFQVLALANVVPNLLLVVTVAIGYMRGRTEGIFVGFFSGLLVDMVYGDVIGICAFIYMFIGFLIGFCKKIYYKDEITIPIILVCISDFLYNFLYYTFTFLLRNRLELFYYIRRIIIPEIVYTALVSIFLYKALHSLNEWLEQSEQEEV
jgi:rod shape-determining protein MreD